MRQDIGLGLVRAHYKNDEGHFRVLVAQMASEARDPRRRDELLRLANKGHTLRELPREAREIVWPLDPVDVCDMVLADTVLSGLLEIVREIRHRLALELRGIPARSRLLFHGPPGNGKTMAAAMMGTVLGIPSFSVSLPNLIGSHLGETGQNMAKIMPVLGAGALVVFDELDAVGTVRGAGVEAGEKENNRIVNTLLTLLDRDHCGVFIGTTNEVDLIDTALRRRFDAEIQFPGPTKESCDKLVQKLCAKYGMRARNLSGESYDDLTKQVVSMARETALEEIEAAEAETAQGGSR